MQIAVTGATGFVGRYIVRYLVENGHRCRCWHRPGSDRTGLEDLDFGVDWLPGELGDADASAPLVADCGAVVHAALYHPGGGFRGGEGNTLDFVERNVVGTIRLIEAARAAGVGRFVFISSCAVHDKIYDDRPLDERHPTTPMNHYGAHKAALEQFVHSYGWGQEFRICALRPTGVYGVAQPVTNSKWFQLVRAVVQGEDVTCARGGKEVHAADVAKATGILLVADDVAGEAYNCYDKYISDYEVASIAKNISGSRSTIYGAPSHAQHRIVTEKLRRLEMDFGGTPLLVETIEQLVAAVKRTS